MLVGTCVSSTHSGGHDGEMTRTPGTSDPELERLESRWRHIGDVVLVLSSVLLVGAVVLVPLGGVADTDCGTLWDHPSSSVCDDRIAQRALLVGAIAILTIVTVVAVIVRRRRRARREL